MVQKRAEPTGIYVLKPYRTTFEEHNTASYFPEIKDLAYLACAVYDDNKDSTLVADLSHSSDDDLKLECISEDWILLTTVRAGGLFNPVNGYYGATYFNTKTKVLVIAHRGTNVANVGSLITDVISVVLDQFAPQIRTAFRYTKEMLDAFQKCASAVFITGHSLGGWLSQTSTFFVECPQYRAKMLEAICDVADWNLDVTWRARVEDDGLPDRSPSVVHCTVFESPGASNFIEKFAIQILGGLMLVADVGALAAKTLLPEHAQWIEANITRHLDITNFLAEIPSPINACNDHVGQQFAMKGVTGHSIGVIVNFWQNKGRDIGHVDVRKVLYWPSNLIQQLVQQHPQTEESNAFKIRGAFFSKDELHMLLYISQQHAIGSSIPWSDIVDGDNGNVCDKFFKSYTLDDARRQLDFKEGVDVRKHLNFFKHVFECNPTLEEMLGDGYKNSKMEIIAREEAESQNNVLGQAMKLLPLSAPVDVANAVAPVVAETVGPVLGLATGAANNVVNALPIPNLRLW